MAEIGVLELTIEDNSQSAGQGLKELAGALIDVKEAVGKGITGLSTAGTQIKTFADKVSANSQALKNIGTLLNAVAEYQRVFKDTESVKFNSQPIIDLKTAFDDGGIKIGNAGTQVGKLREALAGEWNTANTAAVVVSMTNIASAAVALSSAGAAKTIKNVADSIDLYATATNKIASGGAHDFLSQQMIASIAGVDIESSGKNVGLGLQKGMDSVKETVANASSELAKTISNTINSTLLIESPSRVTMESGRYAGLGAAEGLLQTKGEVQSASEEVAETVRQAFYNNLNIMDFANTPVEQLYKTFNFGISTVNNYKDTIGSVVPTLQKMSDSELEVELKARRVTQAVAESKRIIDELKAPIDYSNFDSFSEHVAGVFKQTATYEEGLSGLDKKIEQITGASFLIPAMDQSGTFKYASEEIASVSEELHRARENVALLEHEYTKFQNQLKYGGGNAENAAREISNIESVYLQSLDRVYQLENRMASLNEHVANYATNIQTAMSAPVENALSSANDKLQREEQARMERNYAAYRELFLSGESDWQQQAIKQYGFTANAFKEGETYAEALKITMQDLDEEIERYLQITNTPAGPLLSEQLASQFNVVEGRLGDNGQSIIASMKSAEESANVLKWADFSIDNFVTQYSHIEYLREKIVELKSELEQGLKLGILDDDAIDASVSKIRKLQAEYDKLLKAQEASQNAKAAIPMEDATTMVDSLVNNNSEIDLMTMKLDGMKQALAEDISQNRLDAQQIAQRSMAIQQLRDKIEDLKRTQEETTGSTTSLKDAWNKFKKGLEATFPTISSLVKRFSSMIKMRAIRYVIREVAKGLSEGIKNVYFYSQTIGGSFATNMDNAATSLQTMKNSIGAALAPAISALIPYLQTLVNWFITLVNYVNQFFALLNGQSTWTKALDVQTSAYDDNTKAAKNASDAAKDLLADWDELNIIQSSSSGAGTSSSSTDTDYASMFEEVSEYEEGVRSFVSFVKDNFESILATVLGIKVALKAWKLASALSDSFPFLSTLMNGVTLGATIALTIALTDLTGKAYIDSGNPAYLIADALTGAVGSTIAKKIATKLAGTSAGTVVQGFTLILAGAVNVKNAVAAASQEKNAEAWALGVLGSIEAGIGAGLVAAGFAATTAVSIAAGVLTFGLTFAITAALILDAQKKATYRQMAIDAFRKTGEGGISAEDYLTALQTRLNELTSDAELVINASMGLDEHTESFESTVRSLKSLNALVSGGEALSEEDANKFKSAWETVLEELSEISTISYDTIYAGLEEAIANGSETIKKEALELRTEAIRVANTMGGAEAALKKEMEFLENELLMGREGNDNYDAALERYKEIYSVLSDSTETGLDEFKQALADGAKFDFTGEDNPIGAAIDFVESLGTDLLTPALEKVQEQYDAEIAAIQESQKNLEKYHRLGKIGDEEYNELSKYYQDQIDMFTRRLAEQKEEIQSSTQEAINTIAMQSIEGYMSLGEDDEDALKSYVDNILIPLKKAIEESGNEVPEELAAIIARGGKKAVFADAAEQLRESSREAIYENFLRDFQVGNNDDPVKFAVAYELDLVQQDPSKITDEAKKDIINSLYSVFGTPDMFDVLNKTFGWGYQEIIDSINTSAFTDEELADLQDTIDIINKYENLDLHMPEVNTKEVVNETDQAAKKYEDMATRIRGAFSSLDGLGFNLNLSGTNGKITVAYPTTMMATGGFVKSGDLVMANENGNFEMMGRMGSQPVVANNQQIVSGISQGVTEANSGVESRLGTIETLLNRILSKEFVATAVPSSSWGAMNNKSDGAYRKVTG